jgi:hypothetical protein
MAVEIDENELAILRGAHKLLDQLHTSPKTRRSFQKAVKELHPSTITDEDRVNEAPEVQRLSKLEKTVTDFIDGFNTKVQDAEIGSAFGRLRDQGYTDEGIEKIKKLMVDRKIADPEAGAALFDKINPAKELPPSGFQPSSWNFGGMGSDEPDTKLLFENEDAWAEREAMKVIREG